MVPGVAGTAAVSTASYAVLLMMRPQGFQRLRQFSLIQFAILVRIKLAH